MRFDTGQDSKRVDRSLQVGRTARDANQSKAIIATIVPFCDPADPPARCCLPEWFRYGDLVGVGRNLAWFWVVAALVVSSCGTSSSEIDDLQAEVERLNDESGATSSTTAGSSGATVKSSTTSSPTTTSTSTVASDEFDESGGVVSITDGDTIRVVVGGVEEPVRLIGINAPEGGECLADQATGRLRELVDRETVGLGLDV